MRQALNITTTSRHLLAASSASAAGTLLPAAA
jgi:hypothetical protein